ncbi:Rv3235 family protein [Kitasatospora sp. NPDC054939]
MTPCTSTAAPAAATPTSTATATATAATSATAHHRAVRHVVHARRPPAPERRPRHPRADCEARVRSHPPHPGGPGRAELTTRFAHRLVEVLTGARPCGQLQRHTTTDGYGQLAALVRSGTLRRGGPAAALRLGPVHDRSPAGDAVEACVRVDLGARQHMVAFRLERLARSGQWQCAAVEAR